MSRASGRFAMALHGLALLACSDEALSSDSIAASVGTTAAHIRQIFSLLVQAGLVEARQGRAGGYRLLRAPEAILLSEVFRVVLDDDVLSPSAAEPCATCLIGSGIRQAFEELSARTSDAVMASLARETLLDLTRRTQRIGGAAVPTGFRRL